MRLHLVLEYRYYDAIDRGEKKVEYRRLCDYWIKRILGPWSADPGRTVVFHRGYSATTMEFKAPSVVVDVAADQIKIRLGERVQGGG